MKLWPFQSEDWFSQVVVSWEGNARLSYNPYKPRGVGTRPDATVIFHYMHFEQDVHDTAAEQIP